MEYRKECKVYEAAAKEGARYLGMVSPRFEPACAPLRNLPALVATDGKILAMVAVSESEGKPDTAGSVPEEAMKAAAKLARGSIATIHANGALSIPNGPTYSRPESSPNDFPKYQAVVPDAASVTRRVCIDVRLLVRLAKAMGVVYVELGLQEDIPANKAAPIRVRGACNGYDTKLRDDCLGVLGVLMPITFDD